MANSAPLLLRLLASSVTAATRAGKIIRDVMSRGQLDIIDKGVNDLQTEADRSAQRCIIASLTQQYPDLHIIGEEESLNSEVPSDWIVTDLDKTVLSNNCPNQYLEVKNDDIVVWVDPLDGTSQFTKGFVEHITVLIGLSVKGKAVGGVIHQPYYNQELGEDKIGRTIWGLIGLGVGGMTPIAPPSNRFIVVTTETHGTDIVEETLNAIQPDEILRISGSGYKVVHLLEGKAHAYIYPRGFCKKWDTCASEAVLTAAGGRLTDVFNNTYKYDKNVEYLNKGGIFASAIDVDLSAILKKIPSNVKDTLK